VSLEIILACLLQIGIVAFLVLIGYLLQGRAKDHFSHMPYRSENRLLPNRMELLRQRRRQRHSSYKRYPFSDKLL
jgi:hypothetical protein